MNFLKGLTLLTLVSVGMLCLSLTILEKGKPKELPVSLPEELPLVKSGDTLYVTGVTDSIYIGFNKYVKK